MIRLLVALLVLSTPAAAQMSPVGCNALSEAADRLSDNLEVFLARLDSPGMRKATPFMPESAQDEARDLEDAQVAAQVALVGYQRALRNFSSAIHDCGAQK